MYSPSINRTFVLGIDNIVDGVRTLFPLRLLVLENCMAANFT